MARSAPKKSVQQSDTRDESASPESQLGDYLKKNEDDHLDFTTAVNYSVSTGSLGLDIETGGLRPGAHRVGGGPNLGKTPFALNIIDNFLDTVPNSRAIWCKSEGRLSPENLARVRHPVVFNFNEWKTGTIYVFRCNIYDTWIGLMRELITDNPNDIRYGFVTDSLDALNLKNDITKAIAEGTKVAGGALLTKQLFQKMGLAMSERGHLKIFIGQRTADININPYAPGQPRQTNGSGGNGLAHFANEAFQFEEIYEGNLILKDPTAKIDRVSNPAIGHILKVKLKKASKEKRFITVEVPIRYGQVGGASIWREREVGDLMLTWGLVSKGGTWLTLTPAFISEVEKQGITGLPEKVQGMNQLYALLDERKDLTDYLFAKFKAMASGTT